MTLSEQMDNIIVVHRDTVVEDDSENYSWPDIYPYAVMNEDGIVALFMHESAALFFRLSMINQRLNDGWQNL